MVKITRPAQNDLKKIHEYIAEDSLYYAREMVQSILQEIKKLGKFPTIGRIVPEIEEENIREIICQSYRIVYRIKKNIIEVAAIIHAKRDFKEAAKDQI